jgi:hypothetical protein
MSMLEDGVVASFCNAIVLWGVMYGEFDPYSTQMEIILKVSTSIFSPSI